MSSSDSENAVIQPPLPQSVGYVVVVVIGLVIALGPLFPVGLIKIARLKDLPQ